ncbi:hypothetical protein PV08_04501 [Exophiala spinifera]|uniref:Uncharacterized protein n=1 Tax=Exophiala spinifera TaxID=91928 RepID=A0A0D2C0U9_9EURO|nr:uncharacterized protein PV08_04501 [Exophiala spinifera]KIW17309.1 hypothetical protein PV08_04501 [Exophiala spinifera]
MLPLPVRQHAGAKYRNHRRIHAIALAGTPVLSDVASPFHSPVRSRWVGRASIGRSRHQSRSLTVSRPWLEAHKPAPKTRATHDAVVLSSSALLRAAKYRTLATLLQKRGRTLVPQGASISDVSFEDVLNVVEAEESIGSNHSKVAKRLREVFPGRSLEEVMGELELLEDGQLRKSSAGQKLAFDERTKNTLINLGLVDEGRNDRTQQPADHDSTAVPAPSKKPLSVRAPTAQPTIRRLAGAGRVRPFLSSRTSSKVSDSKSEPRQETELFENQQEIDLEGFDFKPLDVERSQVPQLSHDLSRVLFNPGVYQLQDPRSRVWNFDPYLGKLMPVSEFNYDALNQYITSSQDQTLRDVALQHDKRYIGSTSSMSGVLAHFHFLLSRWRELTLDHLSRGFRDDGYQFTKIQRGPSAIFLKYKDGVYAVDADKEYDSANILMSLGRSMEKLLTNDKDVFETYRKTRGEDEANQAQPSEPEAYHYSELGSFLIRSQLDAYDPRLPGTGMFDLKTRAVAAVRMMVRKHEQGVGYQIKQRFGTWESYEREYYDMMRSAFLKYSLQVRMGRMDGIFVAYHNTERLFGFQYIPLSEMDLALHGQTDATLGDREFRHSIKLLTEIFNAATERFPEQSLRFHFETREATQAHAPYMYIFAEPVTDEEIVDIQNSNREEIEAFEQRIFNPEKFQKERNTKEEDLEAEDNDLETAVDNTSQATSAEAVTPGTPNRQSNAADVDFLESLMGVDLPAVKTPVPEKPAPSSKVDVTADKPLLGWKLNITNLVNKLPVDRPQDLKPSDSWSVRYSLTPMKDASSRRNYVLCKNRRKSVLQAPQDEDTSVQYYIQRLVSMSKEGAKWRRKLDEFDAQREKIVLYGDRISGEKPE